MNKNTKLAKCLCREEKMPEIMTKVVIDLEGVMFNEDTAVECGCASQSM